MNRARPPQSQPYVFASGEAWGEEPDLPPAPLRRPATPLALRAWRAKHDPLWASRSEKSKARLIEMDRRTALRLRGERS
jgi:hypothetical protein